MNSTKSTGKREVYSRVSLENRHDLSLAYTPRVVEVCREIEKNEDLAYRYTLKGQYDRDCH